MSVLVITTALKDVELYFERAGERATEAARMAINDVAAGPGMKLLRTTIEDEVAFPKGYVNRDRLYVKKRATNADLEAVVAARDRPTSLARFSASQTPATGRKAGVRVTVHPGQPQTMKSAFLIRLNAGKELSDTNFNLGLAIRLRPGQEIHNKKKQSAVQLDHNLYLLYGPSVGQVARDVFPQESGEVLEKVSDEFFRQFARLGG